MRVFLGGTYNKSTWRKELISRIKCDYFNPVIDNWDDESKKNEEHEKEICDYLLFVITPDMKGVFPIAEAVDLSNKNPAKVLFCVIDNCPDGRFDKEQKNNLFEVAKLINRNGGTCFNSLNNITEFLNSKL